MRHKCIAALAMAIASLCGVVHTAPYPANIMAWTEADRQQQIADGKTQYDALYDAYNAGANAYTIPPGDYRWGVGGKIKYLLNNLTNFTISAYGATFWVDTDTNGTVRGGFSLNNCSNVALEGVSVDCHPLPFTQGRVTGWNEANKTLNIEVDAGYPTLIDQNVTNSSRIGYFSEDGVSWLNNRTDGDTQLALLTNGQLRLTFPIGRVFAADEDLHIGKRIAIMRESGAAPFAEDHRCKQITFKDCTCYTSAGAIFGGQGENIVIDGAHCIRRPDTDRLLGFVTTGHHSSLRNGVHLKNSEFSYSMDDFMNMDAVANYVFQKENNTTLLLFSRNLALLDGGAPFDPGDTMLFYTYNTFYKSGESLVSSVEQITNETLVTEARVFPNQVASAFNNPTRDFLNGGLWRVTFAAPLPDVQPTNWCYSTAYACEGALFENCRFFNGGQTAGRILLSNNSAVRNCTFENIRSVAIQAGWNQASMNGPVIHNLTVESNTFINCGYHLRSLESFVEALGNISIVNVFVSGLCDSSETHDIVIRNNTFTDSALGAIHINNARNCTIESNTIIRPGAQMPLGAGSEYGVSNAAYGIFLHAVTNAVVTNNVMTDFTEYTKGFIGITPYTSLNGNSLTIDGFGPLTAAPAAVIQSPADGEPVPIYSTVPVAVNAGDCDGTITNAVLLVDGFPAGSFTNAPFHFSFSAATLSSGEHTLQIRTYDNSGNNSTSRPVGFYNPDKNDDIDGDGQSAEKEYVFGTSDYDPTSYFTSQINFSSGVLFSIRWNGITNRSYRLWRRNSLIDGAWELLQSVGPLGENQTIEIIDSGTNHAGTVFYRVDGTVSIQ